jgi:DNA-binding NtrC family response regulator
VSRRAGGGQLDRAVRVAEAQAIREALERTGGSRLAAARELGLHKSTFFRKVKALGLDLPGRDGRSGRS